MSVSASAQLSAIKLIAFDVDGVLTDGSLLIGDDGREFKRFHVRDGLAISAALSLGVRVGFISGRASRAVTLRAAELGMKLVVQGTTNKREALETLCQEANVLPEESAFVGDDLQDLPALLRCGYPIAVADAAAEVKAAARHLTKASGGQAVAREVVEHILRAQKRWDEFVERFGL
jgi:3-deoxy-D-manno-octulosonate 8-phosphate phosphatase (KDO 8-P phosphatase)